MINEKSQIEDRVLPQAKLKSAAGFVNNQLNPFAYLFSSYLNLNKFQSKFKKLDQLELFEQCSSLIINMCRSIINLFESDNELESPGAKFAEFICRQLAESSSYNESSEHNRTLLEAFFDLFIKLFEDSKECVEYFAAPLNFELFFAGDRSKLDTRLVKSVIEDEVEIKFFNQIFQILNRQNIKLIEQYSNEYLQNIELVKFLTRSKLMKYLFVYNSFLNHSDMQVSSTRGVQWQAKTLIGKLLTPSVLPLRKFKPQPNQPGKIFTFISSLIIFSKKYDDLLKECTSAKCRQRHRRLNTAILTIPLDSPARM
jgi:hypothetical protein